MKSNDTDTGSGRGPVMLIADDHNMVRRLLRDWISLNFPGADILEARTGEEAKVIALDRQPAVILMDIWMPEMNGIEATDQIKAYSPDINIVIITSDENSCCRERAYSAGANAYVLKREISDDLIPVLKNLLNRRAGAEA